MSDAFKHIFRKKGFSGFYAGYPALVFREVPFSGLQFPLYEFFKRT